MSSAHLLRLQIESALASRIPSALTPAPRVIRPTAPTGIAALDEYLKGGFPVGALTELAGAECSGRTSLALSFVAGLTAAGRVCAWVDVSNCLDPESAAALGVDLDRLLWIRCGAEPRQLSLPGLVDPREFADDLPPQSPLFSAAKQTLAVREDFAPRCAEPQPRRKPASRQSREAVPPPGDGEGIVIPSEAEGPAFSAGHQERSGGACTPFLPSNRAAKHHPSARKPWTPLDQALRATDLLLQAGGFSAIVLDMGGIAPEFSLRVPLATWFRYRAAAERTHASVLLLTQQSCAKSSAGLLLHLSPGPRFDEGGTVLTAAEYRVEVARERFNTGVAGVTPFGRKPPQSDRSTEGGLRWQAASPWTGRTAVTKAGRR
jgi:recombination protein RecA